MTYLNIVPWILTILTHHVHNTGSKDCLRTLRSVISHGMKSYPHILFSTVVFLLIGELLTMSDVRNSSPFVNKQCHFYNCYGHMECSGTAIQYVTSGNRNESEILPMGRPMANVRIYLVDEYLQPIIPGVQTGEILIGGKISFPQKKSFFSSYLHTVRVLPIFVGFGIFAGYYNSKDLTNTVLCNYNGEICYRTGDLAWLNVTDGQLEYRGCRNDQLKLRSHSIDFEDVTSVLKEIVTNCVLIKSKLIDIDYLVAYVQTTCSVRELRQHCLARLPSYLVPSAFIIVNDLPADQSGQINLPLPDSASLLMMSNTRKELRTDMEERVRQIWHETLPHIESISSIWKSFFSLGDDPGSFVRLLHLYSINFSHTIPTVTFLKHPTIAEHSRLLLNDFGTATSLCKTSQSVAVTEGKYHLQLLSTDYYELRNETM